MYYDAYNDVYNPGAHLHSKRQPAEPLLVSVLVSAVMYVNRMSTRGCCPDRVQTR